MDGLYIHIPFCLRKCLYCDFASGVPAEGEMEAYVDLLLVELNRHRMQWSDFHPASVFFGGGTPSLLPCDQLERILESVASFGLAGDVEITLEANPGTFGGPGCEKARLWRGMGINRVSMGVQAIQDRLLSAMGRMHRHADTERCLEDLRNSGFENINMDFMFGLPGQTLSDWEESLAFAIRSQVPHLSCYSLQVEEGTPWGDLQRQGGLILPDEEEDRLMYRRTVSMLKEAGVLRYEISNFARPGFECRHNLVYWKRGNYLGAGCAAHSFMNGRRFGNSPLVSEWTEGVRSGNPLLVDVEEIDAEEALRETLMLELRLDGGVRESELALRFGTDALAHLLPVFERQRLLGLLYRNGDAWCLTESGVDLANRVISAFFA